MAGPLEGLKVVEFSGLGPAPFAAMVLADLGAEVVRIERPGHPRALAAAERDLLRRGRRSILVDLKRPAGVELARRLVTRADVLLEGFRPGVMERLGLGPDVCLTDHPGLVYGRMTGWGQDGPLVDAAGHDINYIALAGALHHFGRAGQAPTPPVNIVGDFGGGGMLLVVGVLAALFERQRSGEGQVVDAAMVDGASLLMTMIHSFYRQGNWKGGRGENMLDTGAPWYEVYETADAQYVSVGAIEPQFYATLLDKLGIERGELGGQFDRKQWPGARARFAEAFRQKTLTQWCELLEGSDACFAPVLDFDAAAAHPHARARGAFVEVAGVPQPAPAPRFGRTPNATPEPPPPPGRDTDALLESLGLDAAARQALRADGVVG